MAWIAQQTGQSFEDLERVVNKRVRLLGISGISSDLRALEKAGTKATSVRSWLSIPSFTGLRGISPGTRRRCTARMGWSLPAVLAKTRSLSARWWRNI